MVLRKGSIARRKALTMGKASFRSIRMQLATALPSNLRASTVGTIVTTRRGQFLATILARSIILAAIEVDIGARIVTKSITAIADIRVSVTTLVLVAAL